MNYVLILNNFQAGTLSSEDLSSLEVTNKFEEMVKNASKNIDASSHFPLNADTRIISQAVEKVGKRGYH